jgi:hypothetical protein
VLFAFYISQTFFRYVNILILGILGSVGNLRRRDRRGPVSARTIRLCSVAPGVGLGAAAREAGRIDGCIGCGSAAISERRERTVQGYRRFRCRACGKQFNELSTGVLNRTQYPGDAIALVVSGACAA